jgi:Winged helix DNA-binding domain
MNSKRKTNLVTVEGAIMTNLDIAHQRLHNQLISQRTFEKPGDVVEWLGAVQAQDYAAAKWAVGLRLQGTTDDDIEQAFAGGAILRTHLMRPTWHFVSPADIRWMLALTAPRINAANAYHYRRLELDDAIFTRSNAALANALQGGKQLTRPELVSMLKLAGITTGDLLRFAYIMMRAELDGIVCSGARRGKQFTYTLLDERAPQARTLDRDEALAEFARRYFTSHGPATLQDFVWWSGLTVADARAGLEMVTPQLMHEVINGQAYWFSMSTPPAKDLSQTIYLLPNFDEYTVGYTDRSAVIDVSDATKFDTRGNVLNPTIVMDGRVVGTWKRTLKKDAVIITPNLFAPLNEAETRAFAAAANRYGAFLDRSVNITFQVE